MEGDKVKRAFITGANRGIGFGFVKEYLTKGYEVYACTRVPEKAKDLIDLATKNDNLHILKMDIADEDSIIEAVASVKEPIDLLINNAGVIGDTEEDLDSFQVDTMLDTFLINTVGPLLVLSSLREHLAKSEGKQVVNISARMGSISENATGGYYSYRASKTALNSVMRTAAIELEMDKIHTLIMHPGWVRTDIGGENATVSVEESVINMTKVIENYRIYPTGSFVSHTSELLPW